MAPMPTKVDRLWADCCERIRKDVPPIVFSNWFRPVRLSCIDDAADGKTQATLSVPSRFHMEMLRDRHLKTLQDGMSAVLDASVQFHFEVVEDVASKGDRSSTARDEGSAQGRDGGAQDNQSVEEPTGERSEERSIDAGQHPDHRAVDAAPSPVQAGASPQAGASSSKPGEREPSRGASASRPQRSTRQASGAARDPSDAARGRGASGGPQRRAVATATPSSSPSRAARQPGRKSSVAKKHFGRTAPAPRSHGRFRPKYTFDRFIEGDCNQLARSAAIAIAETPSESTYNPFLVYGGVGLGKTHLVQAIGNHIHTHEPNRSVVYVSSEEFTSQFVRSIKGNSITEFTTFYRQADVLIVDDVQFFSGKEKTQEEFFHVFNALHQDGKQIVLCADRPPSRIDGIEDRLLSRFQWGLSADVQQPDLETRIAILQCKADLLDFPVTQPVIEYIAHGVRDSIRSLEGALARLKAHSEIAEDELTLSLAQRLLGDVVDARQTHFDVSDIMEAVANYYGLDENALVDRSRKREIVRARQVAMHFAKELTEKSLASIGNHFGGRDHSTVIHSLNAIQDRVDTDARFADELEAVRRTLQTRGANA